MVMNPYEPCGWNAVIDGKQLTTLFHVDNLMAAHMHPGVVTEHIKLLDGVYGTKDPLTVTRGKIHEFLGITIDFSLQRGVAFSQYDFIKKFWKSLPEDLKGSYRNTPAPDYLFKVDRNADLIDTRRKDEYHTATAKSIFLSQRTRLDMQLPTGFHCTRVKGPNVHDWNKLKHMLGYMWKTRYLPLILEIDDDGNVYIYIDGAHAAHDDAKGHSGLYVTMGRGGLINQSKKLGVVINSSTETEIVSTGERFPKCTWFRYFRLAQGGDTKEDILMQDNRSAIILQKNYPYSARKGTKHMHARYFFVADKVANKEVKIIYCPTEKMIADFSSKPTQGQLFKNQRNAVMGLKEEDFEMYKAWYKAVLERYDLWDDQENDLDRI